MLLENLKGPSKDDVGGGGDDGDVGVGGGGYVSGVVGGQEAEVCFKCFILMCAFFISWFS